LAPRHVYSFPTRRSSDLDPGLLFAGVALIVFAMIMSALAHKRLPAGGKRKPLRGVIYSAIAGALMGFFYPQLMRSISPNFNSVRSEEHTSELQSPDHLVC